MKWMDYIWLPKLKVCEYENRGAYIITNYTINDVALHRKHMNRKMFWKRIFGK